MEKKTRVIYVGGINFETTEDKLNSLFREFGEIEEIMLPRRDDGRIKGFAYIRFAKPEQAQAALKKDEATVDGRIIGVEFFRSRKRIFPNRRNLNFENRATKKEEKPKKHKSHKHHHHHHHHHSQKIKKDDYSENEYSEYDKKGKKKKETKEKTKSEKHHSHHHKKEKKNSQKKKSYDYSE